MNKEKHLALYRKYRPESFDEVVGQDSIVSLLKTVVSQKKISHAYLFCGGRGTGKTTVARILAKEIGCNSEDVIEIDAASNRGIDEIRELREAVRTAPFSSPYKVYIVDEVHMLTKEAANALLKTLEEPPSHVVFILATTDPQKLPQTILSRCQIISFSEPDLETLTNQIVKIAKNEGNDLSHKSAELIASHGKGSYRDAYGVLEQILTQSHKKVDDDFVFSYLGNTDKAVIFSFLQGFCSKDAKEITRIISNEETSGKKAILFYDNVLELLRKALLVRIGEKSSIKNFKEEDILILKKLGEDFPYVISSKTIYELLSRYDTLKNSPQSLSWITLEAIFLSAFSTN